MMDAKLEKWIEDNRFDAYGSDFNGQPSGFQTEAVAVYDLRALFDGKVLVPARVLVNLVDALKDARSGMQCIRQSHGDLYGIGFDRVELRSAEALSMLASSQQS
jgi:hypothetical protein